MQKAESLKNYNSRLYYLRSVTYMDTFYYLCQQKSYDMDLKPKFQIVYMEEAVEFLESLPVKAKNKVVYNIGKSMYSIDKDIFKKLENSEIWEFRTLYNGIAYRLFSFWDTDQGTLVVATHGIIKKTQKTPAKEIAKAEALRNEYFNDKK